MVSFSFHLDYLLSFPAELGKNNGQWKNTNSSCKRKQRAQFKTSLEGCGGRGIKRGAGRVDDGAELSKTRKRHAALSAAAGLRPAAREGRTKKDKGHDLNR